MAEPASPAGTQALAALLAERISAEGPVGIDTFMALCLGHPEYGYYMRQDPLGAAGDFTTAPEISQMFGEMAGLWCADLWHRMGEPAPFALAELGPGRGTLMADALRALAALPGCREAARIHLVETSPALRAKQRNTLAGEDITWHESLSGLPDLPTLLIANEFFDALPIRQFVRRQDAWHERLVGLDEAGSEPAFRFTAAAAAADTGLLPAAQNLPAQDCDIIEACPAALAAVTDMGNHLSHVGGAALIVDYGYTAPATGDTLQAVHGHSYADPLENPGAADLTAHVDFAALAEAAGMTGASVWGPVTQRQFLRELGIEARAGILYNSAAPHQQKDIDSALDRLISPEHMGILFKVMAICGSGTPAPAGFVHATERLPECS